MKTFAEILQNTATLFLVPSLGVEQLTYLKFSAEGIEAGDLKKMAIIGVFTGRPSALAPAGVLERRKRFAERQISALVNRRGIAELGDMPHGHGPQLTVKVANDQTSGISSSEIDLGRDKIELGVMIGENPQELRITRILNQDEGMMTLEIGT